MPKKKQEPEETREEMGEVFPLVESDAIPAIVETPVIDKPALCGHVNRHSIGLDKKPDNVSCDKPKGHSGDHSGTHQEYVKQYETKVIDGREVTTVILVAEDRQVQWGDMAGTPVKDIPRPEPPAPPTLANLEKRMQRLEKSNLKPGQFINQ